jgi:hypothetical protein
MVLMVCRHPPARRTLRFLAISQPHPRLGQIDIFSRLAIPSSCVSLSIPVQALPRKALKPVTTDAISSHGKFLPC